jgi:hypothetical protein
MQSLRNAVDRDRSGNVNTSIELSEPRKIYDRNASTFAKTRLAPVFRKTTDGSGASGLTMRRRGRRRPTDHYQIAQRFDASRTIFDPSAQWNARANSGMFCTVPFTRKRPCACGSVSAARVAACGA